MKCVNCGNELKETAKFCNKCGTKVEGVTNNINTNIGRGPKKISTKSDIGFVRNNENVLTSLLISALSILLSFSSVGDHLTWLIFILPAFIILNVIFLWKSYKRKEDPFLFKIAIAIAAVALLICFQRTKAPKSSGGFLDWLF